VVRKVLPCLAYQQWVVRNNLQRSDSLQVRLLNMPLWLRPIKDKAVGDLGMPADGLGSSADSLGMPANVLGTSADSLGMPANVLGTSAVSLGMPANALGTSATTLISLSIKLLALLNHCAIASTAALESSTKLPKPFETRHNRHWQI